MVFRVPVNLDTILKPQTSEQIEFTNQIISDIDDTWSLMGLPSFQSVMSRKKGGFSNADTFTGVANKGLQYRRSNPHGRGLHSLFAEFLTFFSSP